MSALISNPADCEVRGVIRFLQAENVRPCKIHQRLVAVYGEHVTNAAIVRKWCIMFTNGRTDVHDAEKSGRRFGFCRRRTLDPVKFTEDLLRSVVNML